jgi:hypothetical protein
VPARSAAACSRKSTAPAVIAAAAVIKSPAAIARGHVMAFAPAPLLRLPRAAAPNNAKQPPAARAMPTGRIRHEATVSPMAATSQVVVVGWDWPAQKLNRAYPSIVPPAVQFQGDVSGEESRGDWNRFRVNALLTVRYPLFVPCGEDGNSWPFPALAAIRPGIYAGFMGGREPFCRFRSRCQARLRVSILLG